MHVHVHNVVNNYYEWFDYNTILSLIICVLKAISYSLFALVMHVSMTSLLYTCNCVVSIHKLEIVAMHCNQAMHV